MLLVIIGCKSTHSLSSHYVPSSVEDTFIVLDTLLSDSLKDEFAHLEEQEAVVYSHHGLGMYLRNEWGLWANSRLAKYFNELDINHPDDMSSIILTSYHRYLNSESIELESQLNFYIDYWNTLNGEGQIKMWPNEVFLKDKRIPIKVLNKVPEEELLYSCDSTLIVKRKEPSKDSDIEIWTSSSTHYVDSNYLQQYLESELFGEKIYIEGINEQGKIGVVRLKENRFKIVNDTLQELKTAYKVPYDSIVTMNMSILTNSGNKEMIDSISRRVKDLTTERYKVIFHPELFATNNTYYNESSNDTLILEKHWLIGNINVYRVRINGNLGSSNTSYSYLIDEHYKFLEYEGCNREIIKLLTSENLINKE
jgi:hypothetical protein